MKPMSRTLIAVSIAGLLAIPFAVAAQAVAADVPVQAVAQQGDAVAADQAPADKADRPMPSDCLQSTGTRIRPVDHKTGKAKCYQQAPGRSYARSDIDGTGQTDMAQALRRLDPSIH